MIVSVILWKAQIRHSAYKHEHLGLFSCTKTSLSRKPAISENPPQAEASEIPIDLLPVILKLQDDGNDYNDLDAECLDLHFEYREDRSEPNATGTGGRA